MNYSVDWDGPGERDREIGRLAKVEDVAEMIMAADEPARLRDEIKRLRKFVGWVDSWVSNPVTAYSVCALDGLFGMTRDKIAALDKPSNENPSTKV